MNKENKNHEDENEKNDINEIIDLNIEDITGESELSDVGLALTSAMENIGEFASRLQPVMENVIKGAKVLAEMLASIDYSQIFDEIDKVRKNLVDGLSVLNVSFCDEKQKAMLIQSYEKWGQFGWTFNPLAPKTLFFRCPDNIKQANVKALKYCKDETKLFSIIYSCRRVRKDFDEAVFDFENKQYKSCALILFSLIESDLIRTQKTSRKVGKKALENAEKRLGEVEDVINFYQMLMMMNYFTFVKKMFEGSNNFEKQPDVINRHFLCHGMLWRKVKRMDCLELFLVYYNTLQFLEIIYS